MENLGGIGHPTYSLRVDGVRPDAAQILLRLNTVLQGEVLQLLDGHSIVLGVGAHRVPAETQVELKLGQKFLFQVQENEGKLVLKILPEAPQQETHGEANSFAMFQRAAGKDAPIGETLGKLAQALLSLVGESPDPQQANAATKPPGKLPLDPATLGFLRETATALQEEMRALWPQTQGSAGEKAANVPTLTANPATIFPQAVVAQPLSPQAPALPLIVLGAASQTGAASDLPANPSLAASPNSQNPLVLPSSVATPPPQNVPAGPVVPIPTLTPAEVATLAPQTAPSPGASLPPALGSAPAVSRDLLLLLQRPEMRESLASLTRYLESGVVTPESTRPETIRQHVAETGIPLESQLRRLVEGESRESPESLGKKDLKTLLLRVEEKIGETLRRLGDKSQPELEKALADFGDRVKQSRESVEAKQVQNALRQDSGEALHFQIPYQDLGRLKTADLYYDRRQEKERKAPGAQRTVHHLVFLLEMSRIGKLRVDALLRGSRIQIAVNTGEESAAAFLRQRLGDLQGKLEGLGFEVGMLECRSGLVQREAGGRGEFDLPVLGERHLVDLEG